MLIGVSVASVLGGASIGLVVIDPPDKDVKVLGVTLFRGDNPGPPAPVITASPDDPTSATSATFAWSAPAGTTSLCSLDGDSAQSCSSGITYNALAARSHSFAVRAVDGTGRASTPTTYVWTVLPQLDFTVTGAAAGPLAPGVEQPLDLRITNPYPFPIRVEEVRIEIEPRTSTTCAAGDNLRISKGFSGTITVPANGTIAMSGLVAAAQRPAITMLDLPSNQDECKNTTISLRFAGTASAA